MAGFGNIQGLFDKVKNKVGSLLGSGGDESPFTQSPTRASVVFGRQETSLYDGMPYVGFQYLTRINFNGSRIDSWISEYLNQIDRTNLHPLVKSIDLPSMSIDTDDMNEYNRHRLSQTRINYDPITMVIHDTVDGRALNFWKMYYNYYFQDGLEVFESTTGADINPLAFDPLDTSFGYNLYNIENERNLITSIDIFRLGGANKIEKVVLYNPRITKFAHDEMSYSKSSETISLTFTLEYEFVQYFPPIIYSDDEDVTAFLSYGQYHDVKVPGYTPENARQSNKTGTAAEQAAAQTQDEVSDKSLLDQALDLKDAASSIMGDVATVSALSGELNQLQRDLFGEVKVKVPGVNVRKFNTKIGAGSGNGYQDVSRVLKSGASAFGSLGGAEASIFNKEGSNS